MAAPGFDPARLPGLFAAKLGALVAEHQGPSTDESGAPGTPRAFAGGAGLLMADGTAWVLVEAEGSGLGAALAWTAQQGADRLELIVDGASAPMAGTFARQARTFGRPPRVWAVNGRTLVPVAPAPYVAGAPVPPAAAALVGELEAAGLEVVIDEGIVRGEIRGLEVAVIAVDEEGTAHVEVGVGRHDRDAFGMLHGDLPPRDAIRSVVDTVSAHRRPGAPSHPLNRLAAERWLRWHLVEDADRLPGWHLEARSDVIPRASVQDRRPAFAQGTDDAGAPVVVACSVGIDLELVPTAADVRMQLDPSARLVLALPARDAHAVTLRLAAALAEPAEVLPIEGDWRR